MSDNPEIATLPCPTCYLCGSHGEMLYVGLTDAVANAAGKWDLKRCSSDGCGLLWLDPMPRKDEIGKAYESYYTHHNWASRAPTLADRAYKWVADGYLAKKYGYRRVELSGLQKVSGNLLYFFPLQRAYLEFNMMYLPHKANGRLLEIGCGSGQILKRVQDLGWECEGLDFDPNAVRNACAKGLKVKQGELEAQAYPPDSFDAVTVSHVIEHVHDPRALLRESHRILRKGGLLVCITPNTKSLGHRLYRRHWRGLEPPRHLHLFSANALAAMAAGIGYEIVNCATTIRGAHWNFIASEQVRRKITRAQSPLYGLPITAMGRVLQAVEWLALKFDRGAGEETALILRK